MPWSLPHYPPPNEILLLFLATDTRQNNQSSPLSCIHHHTVTTHSLSVPLFTAPHIRSSKVQRIHTNEKAFYEDKLKKKDLNTDNPRTVVIRRVSGAQLTWLQP